MTDSPETKVRKSKRRTWLVVLSVTIATLRGIVGRWLGDGPIAK